jgi:membrane protein DedA with SNARE-associated domain
MELILQWVLQYKYFGIVGLLALGIIGVPIPDESTLVFLGFLVYRQRLELVPTLLAAFLGSAAGMTVSYLLGHTFGLYLLHRFGPRVGLTSDKVERAHAWFARVGKWTLTLGYFIPGVRHLSALVAGSSKLEYPLFALYAYPGALVWTALFIFLGNFLGENWKRLADQFGIQVALGAAVLVVAGLVLLLRRRAWHPRPRP